MSTASFRLSEFADMVRGITRQAASGRDDDFNVVPREVPVDIQWDAAACVLLAWIIEHGDDCKSYREDAFVKRHRDWMRWHREDCIRYIKKRNSHVSRVNKIVGNGFSYEVHIARYVNDWTARRAFFATPDSMCTAWHHDKEDYRKAFESIVELNRALKPVINKATVFLAPGIGKQTLKKYGLPTAP